uniref:Uncharacterized protein n=1 Tax=Graphocephala atropunctata TaxID=36148 RepID=A0A1B6MBD7_9HEMI
MDRCWLDRSDDIRDCLYDISEGDQLAGDESEGLHSDDDVFSIDSDRDYDDTLQVCKILTYRVLVMWIWETMKSKLAMDLLCYLTMMDQLSHLSRSQLST